jgi:hypothetical protein
MRPDHRSLCAPAPEELCSSAPLYGFCRCFLCGHKSGIPLPLAAGQRNWIECERCGLDNEIPGAPDAAVIAGRVPTRFF